MLSKQLEYVICNVCGSDDYDLFFIENNFHVVRCKTCGLVYVNPRPVEDCAEPQHGEEYGSYLDNYINLKDSHRDQAVSGLKQIHDYASGGRILDIGCAAGFFLNEAAKAGWESCGVEPVGDFARYARENFPVQVENKMFEDVHYPDFHFDVVTNFNILSHLRDPSVFFQEIFRILKPGGLLMCQTGNGAELASREKMEILRQHWNTPEHLYHFSRRTLTSLLEENKFKIITIKRESVLDQLFSRENLLISKSTKIKYLIKRCLAGSELLRTGCRDLFKFYYIWLKGSDVCSLTAFARKT